MLPFYPRSVRTALIVFTNPKPVASSYEASLQLGTTEVARAAFTLDGGRSAQMSFMVTMPDPGTYPVYLFVSSGGNLIATFISDPVLVMSYVPDYKVGWAAASPPPVVEEWGVYGAQELPPTRITLEKPRGSEWEEFMSVSFRFSSLTRTDIKIGEPVIVVVWTRKGDFQKSHTREVPLYIDGVLMGSQVTPFYRDANSTAWKITFMSPGSYLVDVEGLLVTFSIISLVL